MIGMRQYVTAMKAPSKPPEPEEICLLDKLIKLHHYLRSKLIDPHTVSIALPADDWDVIKDEIEVLYGHKPAVRSSKLRYCDIELLRGDSSIEVWFSAPVSPHTDALRIEIIRRFSGGRVGKLPESTSGNRVSASPDSGGKIGVTSSPTIGNNRNGNGTRHIPDQLDVVSAQAAIAAYARDKKLPGSVSLAQLRELDNSIAAKKPVQPIYMGIDLARDIQGDGHSLSSEPLSCAINQLNVAEDGRAHRDFIGAAAQGFAEMLDVGDASAHRKR